MPGTGISKKASRKKLGKNGQTWCQIKRFKTRRKSRKRKDKKERKKKKKGKMIDSIKEV